MRERVYEPTLHILTIQHFYFSDPPVCGHPGLPGGGELVSPPGPGLPGTRAVFSAGDVATFGCQASPQQTKHHAASAVIIVINQNSPPSRGSARACNDCNAGLITGLQ